MFTALISGTLKAVDVGKAATGTLGRIASDIFSQTIKDKLKFELNLFNNLKQLPTQMNNALASGGGGGLGLRIFGYGGGGIPHLGPETTFSLPGVVRDFGGFGGWWR